MKMKMNWLAEIKPQHKYIRIAAGLVSDSKAFSADRYGPMQSHQPPPFNAPTQRHNSHNRKNFVRIQSILFQIHPKIFFLKLT